MIPDSIESLEEWLSRPTPGVLDALAQVDGDILVLGAGGKMGPTLARMARRACDALGGKRTVTAVSRFSDATVRRRLERAGVATIAADLLDQRAITRLPDAENIVYMAGFKFGASAAPAKTWAMNCWLPGLVCQRFPSSRIVAFSSGNVYGPVRLDGGGSREEDEPHPVGEYAMTCLGRERMFQYFSETQKTPVVLLRLNYATELRYGVLVDIARQVMAEEPVDVRTPMVNVIWLADANAIALASLMRAASPSAIINVAGHEMLSVRDVARQFGARFRKTVRLIGSEQPVALLNNGRRGLELLGTQPQSADQMIAWTAEWLANGGATLDKPTHFEVTDGKF